MTRYRSLNQRLARLRGQPKQITVRLDSPEAVEKLAGYFRAFAKAFPDLDYEAIETAQIPMDLEGVTIAGGGVTWEDCQRGRIEITYLYRGKTYRDSDFSELLREK